jgi:hypothetical protein
MLTHLRNNVVAYLALFVAIGGTSYAAVQLPKDSVTAKQIKAGAVRTDEVKNGSLRAADFASGTLLTGARGATGPTWAGHNDAVVVTPTTTSELETLWTFDVPTPGRLFVYADVLLQAFDTDTDCIGSGVAFGLFLDGVPVPGGYEPANGLDTFLQLDRQGLTGPVTAGPHTLQVGAICDGTTPTDVFIDNANLSTAGAILVGS